MGARAAAGALHDRARVLRAEAQHQCPVGHRYVPRQRALAGAHGPGDHFGHPHVALQAGHVGRAVLADLDFGDQAGHGRQCDPRLAQRWQDLFDVAQEQRVGPDHQHPLALEREPVGVEEVGGAVQGHRRLAGARTTLDDQDAAERRTDDLVLLGLDGRDDVGHPARPGPVQGGQQGGGTADGQVAHDQLTRRVPGMLHPVAALHGVGHMARAGESLVLDAHHFAALEGQVTAQDETEGVPSGGPVEGLGHRCPPVDYQRLVVRPVDGQTTDVEGLGVGGGAVAVEPVLVDHPVDPPEGQRLVADIELLEAGQAGAHDDVSLGAGLEGAAPPEVEHPFEHGVGVAPHGVQPRVGEVDEVLLGLQLRLHPHLLSGLRLSGARTPGGASGSGEPSIVCAGGRARSKGRGAAPGGGVDHS